MNQPIAARGAEKQTSTFSSRATHWLQHHQREAKDSFARLAQSPLSTLMTVLVMTISLTLPLGLGKLLMTPAVQPVAGMAKPGCRFI